MANYKSRFTGQEIDAAVETIKNGVGVYDKLTPDITGAYAIQPRKKYFIKNSNATDDWGISIESSTFVESEAEGLGEVLNYDTYLSLPAFDRYADGFTLTILGFEGDILTWGAEHGVPMYCHNIYAICQYGDERYRQKVFEYVSDDKYTVFEYPGVEYLILSISVSVRGATDVFEGSNETLTSLDMSGIQDAVDDATKAANRAEAAADRAEDAGDSDIPELVTEEWTFTTEDGKVIKKQVCLSEDLSVQDNPGASPGLVTMLELKGFGTYYSSSPTPKIHVHTGGGTGTVVAFGSLSYDHVGTHGYLTTESFSEEGNNIVCSTESAPSGLAISEDSGVRLESGKIYSLKRGGHYAFYVVSESGQILGDFDPRPSESLESVEGISYDTNKKSFAFMENSKGEIPDASGKYAIAAGTDDTSVLGSLESVAGGNFTAKMPRASGHMSLSHGMSTEAISAGTVAKGFGTQAGVKGYYWYEISISGNTATITLSKNQKLLGLLGTSYGVSEKEFDWKVGDYISIVNDQKYAFCAKITKIETVSRTLTASTYTTIAITVDSAVFGTNAYGTLESLALSSDDKTIFAVSRVQDASTSAHKLVARGGVVELGWGAYAIGLNNLSLGTFGFVGGANNVLAGDFGAIFGRDNLGAYGNVMGGGWNESTGLHSAIFGRNHKNKGDYNIQSGYHNQIESGKMNAMLGGESTVKQGDANLVGGYNNLINSGKNVVGGEGHRVNKGTHNIVTGQSNTVENSTFSSISGNMHSVDGDQVNVSGKNHILTARSNYNAVSGETHSLNTSGHNDVSGKENTLNTCEDNVVGGNRNELTSSHDNLVEGHFHTIALSSYNIVGGEYHTLNDADDCIIGGYGHTVKTSKTSIVSGVNNTSEGVQGNIISGKNNIVKASWNIVAGENNVIKNPYTQVFGYGIETTAAGQCIVGQYNDLSATPNDHDAFIVAFGTKTGNTIVRKNVFTVPRKGTPTKDTDAITYGFLKSYTPSGGSGGGGTPGVGISEIKYHKHNDDDGENVIQIILTNDATYNFIVKNGSRGSAFTYSDFTSEQLAALKGVGISKIEQTTTSNVDGGTNVITVTLTNGDKSYFYIKNGSGGTGGGSGGSGENTEAAEAAARRAETAAGNAEFWKDQASGFASTAQNTLEAIEPIASSVTDTAARISDVETNVLTKQGEISKAISDAKTEISKYVGNAKTHSENASKAKGEAEVARDDARGARDLANTYAGAAKTHKENAEIAANAAQGCVTTVEGYANEASQSKQEACRAETSALQARAEAVAAAGTAKSDAGAASKSASDALGYAGIASDYSVQAKGYKESAEKAIGTVQETAAEALRQIGESVYDAQALKNEVNAALETASTYATRAGNSATSAASAAQRAEEAAKNAENLAGDVLTTTLNIFRWNSSTGVATLEKTLTTTSRSPRLNILRISGVRVTFGFGNMKLMRNTDEDLGYNFEYENTYVYNGGADNMGFAYVDATNPSRYYAYRSPADAKFFEEVMGTGAVKMLSAGATYNIALEDD